MFTRSEALWYRSKESHDNQRLLRMLLQKSEKLILDTIRPDIHICRFKRIPWLAVNNTKGLVEFVNRVPVSLSLPIIRSSFTNPGKELLQVLSLRNLEVFVVELVMQFEEAFDIQIPDEDAEKIKTVKDAVDYIEKSQKGAK